MREACGFFGIIISMPTDDHNPPHFHVRYGNHKAIITIDKGIVVGSMPRKALRQVYHWLDIHRDELMANWQRLQNGETVQKIDPLK